MGIFDKLGQMKDLAAQAKQMNAVLAQEQVVIDNEVVHLVMNAKQDILELKLVENYQTLDKTKLEKRLIDALAEGQRRIQQLMMAKMKSGEINLPNFNHP